MGIKNKVNKLMQELKGFILSVNADIESKNPYLKYDYYYQNKIYYK